MKPLVAVLVTGLLASVLVETQGVRLVSGPPRGLASQYPRDIGIERDPAVVFTEQFEAATLAAVIARWSDSVRNTMSLDSDVPTGSAPGSKSLKVPRIPGDTGGQLFKGLRSYYQTLYVRYYIKYSALGAATPHHGGVWIGGEKVPTPPGPRFPDTHAGSKPCPYRDPGCIRDQKVTHFWVGAEQGIPSCCGFVDSYAAYQNMRTDGDGITGTAWGNLFTGNRSLQIAPNVWTCVEHMVKVNTVAAPGVGVPDGEWALWLNGVPVSSVRRGFPLGTWTGGKFQQGVGTTPFPGIAWRDDPDFGGINWLYLQNYYERTEPTISNVVWFDHVVAATRYIGCLS